MSTEATESYAVRQHPLYGGLRLARDDDLSTVGRPAHPSRCVDRQPDVPGVGQRGLAAVDADPDPALEIVGPRPFAHRALQGYGGLDGRRYLLEDREELVGAGVDLAALGCQHRQ